MKFQNPAGSFACACTICHITLQMLTRWGLSQLNIPIWRSAPPSVSESKLGSIWPTCHNIVNTIPIKTSRHVQFFSYEDNVLVFFNLLLAENIFQTRSLWPGYQQAQLDNWHELWLLVICRAATVTNIFTKNVTKKVEE